MNRTHDVGVQYRRVLRLVCCAGFCVCALACDANTPSGSVSPAQAPPPASTPAVVQQDPPPVEEQPAEIAGTIFGQPTPISNYYFALRVAGNFSTPWGGIPRDVNQLEDRTWDELVLSFEAHRRGVTPTREQVEAEVTETLKGNQVEFDWRADPGSYALWTKETLQLEVEHFENIMKHLVQLKLLREEVLNSIEPEVTEEEAFQEYLNEYNTLSVELAQFDSQEEAQVFYDRVRTQPAIWDQEVAAEEGKPRGETRFRRPGFVALEFLIDMWKFPKDAVYEMLEIEVGALYPPTPIYKGYGVCKVLEIRRANEEEFPSRRDSYYDQISWKKKYAGFSEWFAELKREANVVRYAKPPEEIFQQASPD